MWEAIAAFFALGVPIAGAIGYAIKVYVQSSVKQTEADREEDKQEIATLRKDIEGMRTAYAEQETRHASDMARLGKDNEVLLAKIKAQSDEIVKLREAIGILESAHSEAIAQVTALENRIVELEAELAEKTQELETMRDRLHKAEVSLARSETEAEIYRKNNAEMFAVIKRLQEVAPQLTPETSN